MKETRRMRPTALAASALALAGGLALAGFGLAQPVVRAPVQASTKAANSAGSSRSVRSCALKLSCTASICADCSRARSSTTAQPRHACRRPVRSAVKKPARTVPH